MAGAIAVNNKSGVRNDMRLQDLRYGDGFLRIASHVLSDRAASLCGPTGRLQGGLAPR